MRKITLGPEKYIILILFFGFLLRILSALSFQIHYQLTGYLGYDESVYLSLARNMIQSSPLSYSLRDSVLLFQDYRVWYIEKSLFHHPPLFIWLLFVWMKIFGSDLLTLRFLNIIMGSGIIYVAYLIGRKLSIRVGWISALFIALSPLHIQSSSLILIDNLLALLSAIFIFSVIKISENPKRSYAVVSGIVLGLLLWTKYFGAFMIVFFIPYILFRRIRKMSSLITLSIGGMIFLPWLIWNQLVNGSILPFNTWKALSSWGQVDVPFYAYLVFLPLLAPFTLAGYLSILRLRNHPLKIGLALVFLVFLGFFSFSSSREMRFILPSILPLAVLSADQIDSFSSVNGKALLLIFILATFAFALVFIVGGYGWYLPFWHFP